MKLKQYVLYVIALYWKEIYFNKYVCKKKYTTKLIFK